MPDIVCIGTGPSLTLEQINIARNKGFRLFGCNRVFEIVPDLEVLYGCNLGFWDTYWPLVKDRDAEKWTANEAAALKYGINRVRERNAPGLSLEPGLIHHGHGSGYSLVNLAALKGAERIILLGYDLRYAADYDGNARRAGSTPRHFFGEYPSELQHWPSVRIQAGVHHGLLDLYQTVADQGVVEVVNCTPGSALTCFPCKDISEC